MLCPWSFQTQRKLSGSHISTLRILELTPRHSRVLSTAFFPIMAIRHTVSGWRWNTLCVKNLVRFVVCTSTLAQGVNLPIRYLIVTSVYQGMERIKVRDFHNLIGRAGRAGMYTEGSILFADPVVYDKRHNPKDGWRWNIVKELLILPNQKNVQAASFNYFL